MLNFIFIRYEIKTTYTPPVISNIGSGGSNPVTNPSSAGTSGSSATAPNYYGMNNSSLVSFNLGLSLVCILLTFISNIYFK